MVTPDKSSAEQAGYVVFPRSTGDLTSTTHCPACFSALTSTTCSVCFLDVTQPGAVELHDASLQAAVALERRIELIGRMRSEAAAATAPVPAPAVAPTAAAPTAVAAPPPPPAAVIAPPRIAPAAPAPVADAAPRRHFGVQVILLIVGVSLLAVGAIFFLVYAFITFGLVWRSVIIGAVTVAAFVGASLLRRRKLGATAEAISALAVVFVYLDAFAIKANDLFGAGNADGLVYWGLALLLSAAGFALWHRVSGLRLPNIVAFAAAGPGLALLLAGLGDPLEDGIRVFVTFAGLAVSGLLIVVARSAVERVITLTLGILGLVAAFITAMAFQPQSDWAPAVGLGVLAVIALLQVLVVARVGSPRPLGLVSAGIGGVAASVALLVVGLRVGEIGFLVIAPVLAAAVVALALELLTRRQPLGYGRRAAAVGAWSAAGIGAITVIFPLVTTIGPVATLVGNGAHRWSVPGGDPIDLRAGTANAVLALALVVLLTAAAWRLGGTFARRLPVLISAALAVLILAAPVLGMLWLAVLAWLVIGAVGLVALTRVTGRTSIRVPLVITAIVATTLAYGSSWASIDTWWYGSVGTIALLVVARVTTKQPVVRGILLGVATILAFVAIGAEGWHVNERFKSGYGAALDSVHFVAALAIVLVIVAALLPRLLSAIETRVLFWLAFATLVVTGVLGWALPVGDPRYLVLPEFGTSVVLAAAALGALLVWVRLPRAAAYGVERVAASIAIAPAAAWLADSVVRMLHLPDLALEIAPVAAALVIAAVGLASAGLLRRAREIGIGIVLLPAVLVPLATRSENAWLVLLIAAGTVLLVAVSKDGLFASPSPRKHLGWVALALATAALWLRLADSSVTDIEPYVLPLAGALLIVAALDWRSSRPQPSITAPLVTLGGLIVGIIPVAVVSADGQVLRTVIVAGISALLLLAGSFVHDDRLRPYLDAAALAGALGLVTAAFGRAIAMAAHGATADLALDGWLAGALIVLALAALGQARLAAPSRALAAQLLLAVGLLGTLLELCVLTGPFGTARAATVLLLFCGMHVAGVLLGWPPFTALVGWTSIGVAALAAIVGVAAGVLDPLEWATAALSAALLVTGAVRMRRHPDAGSWGWLAPGILVLLLPSLVATFTEQPVWRLVGLGVACLIAVVVGAVAKLQAPLLIGAVVVLVHAIRTFAPQLVAVYQLTEWWVWAVIGGAIILFLGLTFEKRVRDLRSVATRVSALR